LKAGEELLIPVRRILGKGLWGKPTVINNVETLANIPEIISKGGSGLAR